MPEEQHSEEKKSLFGTKNLKEGAIWQTTNLRKLQLI
jgi:hypothetical protein